MKQHFYKSFEKQFGLHLHIFNDCCEYIYLF